MTRWAVCQFKWAMGIRTCSDCCGGKEVDHHMSVCLKGFFRFTLIQHFKSNQGVSPSDSTIKMILTPPCFTFKCQESFQLHKFSVTTALHPNISITHTGNRHQQYFNSNIQLDITSSLCRFCVDSVYTRTTLNNLVDFDFSDHNKSLWSFTRSHKHTI